MIYSPVVDNYRVRDRNCRFWTHVPSAVCRTVRRQQSAWAVYLESKAAGNTGQLHVRGPVNASRLLEGTYQYNTSLMFTYFLTAPVGMSQLPSFGGPLIFWVNSRSTSSTRTLNIYVSGKLKLALFELGGHTWLFVSTRNPSRGYRVILSCVPVMRL